MQCKKTALRVLSTAAFMAMISSCVTPVFAGIWYLEDGNITVTAKDSGQTVEQGGTTKKDDNPTITQNKDEPTSNTVTINAEDGATANVTLDDVNIKTSGSSSPVDVKGEGTTKIEIDGTVTLDASGSSAAALHKGEDGELVIKDDDSDGDIIATGGKNAAGIGSSGSEHAKGIEIIGGTIVATGGTGAAGIGSGAEGSADVTISGNATIESATGGTGAAGIGSGADAYGKTTVTVSGNAKIESATGGAGTDDYGGGAGIGSGADDYGLSVTTDISYYGGLSSTEVTVSDKANVTATGGAATGGNGGAGIGSGAGGNATVNISGGTVTATGGAGGGAGVGTGGYVPTSDNTTSLDPAQESKINPTTATVNISGGSVTATGGTDGGSGIGGGYGSSADVTITDGTISASAGSLGEQYNELGSGIGSGSGYGKQDTTTVIGGSTTATVNVKIEPTADIKITGGTITKAEGGAAGIGGGMWSTTNITIEGGDITAQGGDWNAGAGIGGSYDSYKTNVDISGGTVVATGGGNAAGVGSGYNSTSADVTISGGTVTATGGDLASGVGGGAMSGKTEIGISGGTVTATGGSNASGIGAGFCNTEKGTVDITGGTITATAGGNSDEAIGAIGSSKKTYQVNDGYYTYNVEQEGTEVTIDSKYDDLDVTAITANEGSAVVSQEDSGTVKKDAEVLKDADAGSSFEKKLDEAYSGIVKFANGAAGSVYKAIHNKNYISTNKLITKTKITGDAATEHNWVHDGDKTDVDPTCTEKGHYYYKCGVVGCSAEKEVEVAELGHDYDYDSPEYSWNGDTLTVTVKCKRDASHTDIAKATGEYTKDSDATCTQNEKGHYTATVMLDGKTYTQSTAANSAEKPDTKLNHDYSTSTPSFTWSGNQLTGTITCIRNDATLTDTKTGTYVKDTDATCTSKEKGHYEATVTLNGVSYTKSSEQFEVGEALGHKWDTDKAVDATCESTGLTEGKHCSVCGYAEIQAITPATGHAWGEWETTTPATCETDGVQTRTCKNDPSHTETRAISKLGHDIVKDAAKAATCTETGLTEGEHCSRGDYTKAQEVVAATGHDWGEWETTTPATCETDGVQTRTCKNDPSHTETRAISKLGHDIVKDAAKAATCTETGLTEGEHCSRGDYTKAQEVVAAKGHAYGEWVVTKEATCSEAGEKTRTCANDASHVEKETIPATGEHSWGEWVYGENIRTRTCTHCGKMQAEEWKKDESNTEEAKQGEYSTYLVVLDNIRMDITADTTKVTMTQVDGKLYVNANGQDVAYLEGNIVELEKLRAQGVQSIVFATASHTTTVNIADIMACGSDDEVFCISHNGGNASLTVAGAAHNELLK